MGNAKRISKPKKTSFAEETSGHKKPAPSDARKYGRRLILKFRGADKPELDRIEFQTNLSSPAEHWQQGGGPNNFTYSKVPQALAVVFLEYLCALGKGRVGPVFLSGPQKGSLAASLGDAIYQTEHRIHSLFAEMLSSGQAVSRVRQVFGGKNVHGKDEGERRIHVRSEFLPPDCLEVYWDFCGDLVINRLDDLDLLCARVKSALGLAIVQCECPAHLPNFPELLEVQNRIAIWLAEGMSVDEICLKLKGQDAITTLGRLESFCRALAPALFKPKEPPPAPECPRTLSSVTKTEARDLHESETKPEPISVPSIPKPPPTERSVQLTSPNHPSQSASAGDPLPVIEPIHPFHFLTYNQGLTWDNNDPLLELGNKEDVWRLKDAFEGVLILGAPGSGKTSGSGTFFAESFIRAGFGGLVLTAKPGEAQRWQRLCEALGRAGDVVTIDRNGPKLNILAYECQRPGGDLALANNLVSFFRVLIETVSQGTKSSGQDDFWTSATNQLMRSLFEAFILAGETPTIDALNQFIALAPTKPLSDPSEDWRTIPFFGSILERASEQDDPEARRVFAHILDYWTREFPSYADRTRSSITLGFTAMADILSSRGIHELICSTTDLTPEAILSGNIVIIDLPLKEFGSGGLLVQAAWKYLFQMAVERRCVADSDVHRYPMFAWDGMKETAVPFAVPSGTGDRRCPVFLWEDEGQFFFSPHDIDFQATARESRAAHIVISQNLHNFHQLGHNPHAVEGLFSLMNTQVFHANGDHATNQWASEKIGREMRTQFNFSVTPEPQPGFWDLFKSSTSKTTTSTSKAWEEIIRPEEFSCLKKGGDGFCEAIVLWVAHRFKSNGGRPFCRLTFNQTNL